MELSQAFCIFINMIKNIKKGILPFIIAFSALSVSASAAFYSVSGLSKLFAGASFEVIIMASSLEIAKLVIASLLYQYWTDLNKILRTYLVVAATILVLITSMGIYGFLSAAYQETYSSLSIAENKKQFIQQKIDFYEKDVERYDKELETILSNINTLSSAKASQIQIKDTSSSTGFRTTVSTTELRMAQKRIEVEEQNRKQVQSKRQVATDSLQKFQLEVLDLENNTDQAGELGPLKYLSGLTGTPMDKIINILLLVIIFVFDPLAISLVIAANFAFEKAFPKKRENLYGELVDDLTEWDNLDDETDYLNTSKVNEERLKKSIEELEVKDAEVVEPEYDTLDLNKDGIIDEREIQQTKNQIKSLQEKLKGSLSSWRKNKIQREISQIQSRLPKDNDTTKTY